MNTRIEFDINIHRLQSKLMRLASVRNPQSKLSHFLLFLFFTITFSNFSFLL